MPERQIAVTLLAPVMELLTSDEERDLVASTIVRLDLSKGEKFITEGETLDCMHYLYSGQVKLCREGIAREEQVVRLALEKRFFGMRPYFAGSTARTSAIACGPAVVIRIPTTTIDSLLKTNVAIAKYFLCALSEEIDMQEARNLSLMQKHLRGRLAETLLMLADNYGYQEDGATLAITLSRSDLGALSNMTTSNASRTLSIFSSERIVALDGRRIRIINSPALEQISRQG